jgi:surface antigen
MEFVAVRPRTCVRRGAAASLALTVAATLLLAVTTPLREAGATPGVNDYPYRSQAPGGVDPWGFYKGECTSFVAWRLTNDTGLPGFRNVMTRNGVTRRLGNASNWAAAAAALGYRVDNTPAPGAVAWWSQGSGRPYGHVAWVESVSGSSVTVEEYNFGSPPNRYGRRSVPASNPTKYIHFREGSAAPFGDYSLVERAHNGVRVAGWTIDPDTNDPIPVHVYANGRLVGARYADVPRPDVEAAFGRGAAHGFDFVVPAGGDERVCVYAINAGGGINPELGCRASPPSGTPFGSFDVLQPATGGLRVAGWAIDPDADIPIAVHVYVDDRLVGAVTADVERLDVGAAFNRSPRHGYDLVVPGNPGQRVCVYAINYGGGLNPQLGCKA